MVIDNKMRKQIEHAFYTYPQRKNKIAQKIADIYDSAICAQIDRVGGRSDAVPNPTESKGVEIADLELDDKWCRVVERTIERFTATEKGELLRLKFFDRRGERHICEKLYIERRLIYFWLEDIIMYATIIAVQYGLIKII